MKKALLLQALVIFVVIIFAIGCATDSLNSRIQDNPDIRSLRFFKVIKISEWKKTDIRIVEGESIILTPIYPKGFIYPVKGKIGKETFDALDVDSGDVYEAKTSNLLYAGVDAKTAKIATGVFIFRKNSFEAIISDLKNLLDYQRDPKIINLTLGIIYKNRSEAFLSKGDTSKILEYLNRAINCFAAVDRETYATTLYRLYKMKANIYKFQKIQREFEENMNLAMDALMRASRYYKLLAKGKYAFLNRLTQEERFLLLIKTEFFRIAIQPYHLELGIGFANPTVAYTMLSRYYAETVNLSLSLKYSELAIEEAKKSGNRNLIAWAYQRGLAARHYALGFFDLAEKEYMTSLKHCSSSASACRWTAQFALALCQYQLGKYDAAEKSLKELQRETRSDSATSVRRIFIKFRLGLIYLEQENFLQAVSLLQSAYTEFKRQKDNPYLLQPTKIIKAGLALCRGYIALKSYDQALHLLNQIREEMSDLDVRLTRELDFKLTQSKLFKKLNKDPAIPLLQAIETLEKIRPTAGTSRDYEYWERMLSVYDDAVDVLFEKGDFAMALEVAEKARSRRFLDHIGSKHIGAKGKVGYLLSQQANDSLESLSLIEKDMLQAAKTAGIKIRNIYQEGTRYSKHLTTLRSKFIKTAAKDQQFESIYNIKPVKLEDIQENLPEDVTIIEFYISDEALYSWVINHKNVFAHKQEISRQHMTTLINRFRLTLSTPSKIRGILTMEVQPAAEKGEEGLLYDILFAPIESQINVRRIGIVPYGVLNYLPFQALHDGKKYLIEKYAISYIPSLSVLKFIQKRQPQSPVTILAFGNPQLGDPALDLPATEKEVEIIHSIFPSADLLKRINASEANAKKMVSQYTYIHFASHGEYVPEVPLASCLRLTPGSGEDGRLEAGEVFNLNLKADMVITSACQTAIGKINKGDEIVGLTRAFIYAGAHSVLGSLWNISDVATAEFMHAFYSNIQNLGKAEALRQAQLKMIASEKYQHPFYWAAFNMNGGL
jgi:CHAT domain-containing protein